MFAGEDFVPGQYNATFAVRATTAAVSIPITADGVEQFCLRLYIDGTGYGLGLQKGSNANAIVSIGKTDGIMK